MRRSIAAVACAVLLSGCATPPPPKPVAQCPLPGEEPYVIAQLFFGRAIPGRAPLTDAEWADFAAHAITPQFPDGFTVLDGAGQWYDQGSGRTIQEQSKILLVAADPDSDLKTRIGSVINAYRAQFHQSSVGLVTSLACGSF
ncbi:MAG TPA: DUF3574 domain-containing protein [Stellaceae bacterium]|nr:DUF3574 domain-containing protein [Stellaceae bacterium]